MSGFFKAILGGIGTLLFGGDDEAPVVVPPAPVPTPPVMPTPDDAAIQKSRRRALVAQRSRRGRVSTVLSTPSETEKLG
jgi:hypothetical protein